MEKVPGHVPRREQCPPSGARVIVWSPCPQKGKRWQRLALLGSGPLEFVSCPHALQAALEEHAPHERPVVLADLEKPLVRVPTTDPLALSEDAWPLLRSASVVAVVPRLTWEEAGPWLLLGARGVVAWQSVDEDVHAMLEAAQGRAQAPLQELLQKALKGGSQSDTPAEVRLSPREHEVVVLLCRGLSNGEIARHMFVSTDDVRHHLKNLYRKLGTRNSIQVLIQALSHN